MKFSILAAAGTVSRWSVPATLLMSLASATFAMPAPEVLLSSQASSDFPLAADADSSTWRDAPRVIADHDPFGKSLHDARTEIRSRWTRNNLYFLFVAHYRELYLQSKASLDGETLGLWNHDVAEVFIGYDFVNIGAYKEFEVSPRGEFIDLDVDLKRSGNEFDWHWDSGFHVRARVDPAARVWVCEMQIPWTAISIRPPAAGAEFRLNLYRIEGAPPRRKFIVWQVTHSSSFHTPDAFGRLRLIE